MTEKPVIFEVSENEGYGFIEMMFRNVLNRGNQVKPNMWRKFVGAIFGDSYSEAGIGSETKNVRCFANLCFKVMRFYDCPCDDKNDPDTKFQKVL